MATSRALGSASIAFTAAPEPRLPQPIRPYLSVSSLPACTKRGTLNAARAVVAAAVVLMKSRRLCPTDSFFIEFTLFLKHDPSASIHRQAIRDRHLLLPPPPNRNS